MAKKKRKPKISIGCDLRPVTKREPNGRVVRTAKETDPARDAMVIRCKLMGLPVTVENLREMRHPMYGCDIGRAVAKQADRADLWDAVVFMGKTIAAYDRACGAPKRHAKCLGILLPLDEMTADAASAPVDDRTDEEKHNQAVAAYMRVQGWLERCKIQADSTKRAVWDMAEVFDRDAALVGLRVVVQGMKGDLKLPQPVAVLVDKRAKSVILASSEV